MASETSLHSLKKKLRCMRTTASQPACPNQKNACTSIGTFIVATQKTHHASLSKPRNKIKPLHVSHVFHASHVIISQAEVKEVKHSLSPRLLSPHPRTPAQYPALGTGCPRTPQLVGGGATLCTLLPSPSASTSTASLATRRPCAPTTEK